MIRISRDEYFMKLVEAASLRGTCERRRVGAVAVDGEGHTVATGYNGAPRGARHCQHSLYAKPEDDPDLYRIDGRWSCARAIHSEANLIAYAARKGIALAGTMVYCDTFPCYNCLKQMITAGVQGSVFRDDYMNDVRVIELAEETGFKLRRFT